MSEYTFQNETGITSTSTTPMAFGDIVPVYSTGNSRLRQATIGSVSSFATVTSATSATTATAISNYGYTSLGSSSGPPTSWTIGAPVAGVLKTIWNTSTSTAAQVSSNSTAITFSSTGGNVLVLNSPVAYVELIGLSTTAWRITASSTGFTAMTTLP